MRGRVAKDAKIISLLLLSDGQFFFFQLNIINSLNHPREEGNREWFEEILYVYLMWFHKRQKKLSSLQNISWIIS